MQKTDELLTHFVTNTDQDIFVLQNLPEVIKGALFSRYSRSKLGLRDLLKKEFLQNEESGFSFENHEQPNLNVQKAVDFYDRILDGYGDDSVAELGGAHLAFENVSMLATKILEDCRIGGSPLEKSTRYIPFDDKVNGEFRYYRDAKIMASFFKDRFVETMDHLFITYSNLIAPMTERIEKLYPMQEGTSEVAYRTSVRAMVFDCLRGLLPAATLTNLGFYGNGRFFESLLMKMRTEPLQEMQTIAENGFVELSKVIPSFVKRANKEHRHFKGYESYMQQLHDAIGSVLPDQAIQCDDGFRVSLVEKPTKEVIDEMCAALMYENTHYDFQSLKQVAKTMSEKRKKELFENLGNIRTNRRNKSPRALEHADFTFEIVADFGCYRDLHRHRILTQKRQHLTCFHGYVVPEEIVGTKMEPIFKEAMERAKSLFIDMHKVMPLQAQYVVPMGYNIRWYIKINLRALQWMCELRSTPQGHPEYRKVAQQMAQCVIDAFDVFRPLLKFVDFSEHAIGRLAQEERNLKKKQGS